MRVTQKPLPARRTSRGAFRRTLLGAATIGLICGASLPAAAVASAAPQASASTDYTTLVNTFVGSANDGFTYPGATAPFGMTQVSPTTAAYTGYAYADTAIRGFGTVNLSGAHMAEQGQVSTLPVVGKVGPGATLDSTQPVTFDQTRYAAPYTHDGEVGQPGYYRTTLTPTSGDITVETTASTRVGVQRYTFPKTQDANVFINVGQAATSANVVGSTVRFVDNRTAVGEVRIKSNRSGSHEFTTWFATRFDRPFREFGTWDAAGGDPGSATASSSSSGLLGGWVTFDTRGDTTVEMSTAISYTGAEGALVNLAAEGLDGASVGSDGVVDPLGFDAVRLRTQEQWNQVLGDFAVTGGTTDQQSELYTALYHAYLEPATGSDADGTYRGYDDALHEADGWTYYQYFSLWDVFRSQNQFLALFQPTRAHDIAKSILAIDDQGGWLPKWGYSSFETNVMGGDSITPYLSDLWRLGAVDGDDVDHLTEALLRNLDSEPEAGSQFQGRAGNDTYIGGGFISPVGGATDTTSGYAASATMEYAVADCTVTPLLASVGLDDDAQRLRDRSASWRNVWDPTLADASSGFSTGGFPRARTTTGAWGTGNAQSSSAGFQEGNAWRYQWLTWQDFPGVIAQMGGKEQAEARLDKFFSTSDVLADPATAASQDWVSALQGYTNTFRYDPNNEPDLHVPWLYDFLGAPTKASAVVQAQQTLFTTGPGGITGNDDMGQMSAWYAFSVLGLYPSVSGSGDFLLSTPTFPRIEVTIPDAPVMKKLVVESDGATGATLRYVKGATLNGVAHDKSYVNIDTMTQGGTMTLSYDLTADISDTTWATSQDSLPVSPCTSVPQVRSSDAFAPMAGSATTGTVATVTASDDDLEGATATIDWGDGSATEAVALPANGLVRDVAGTHTYTAAGAVTVTVEVLDAGSSVIAQTSFEREVAATANHGLLWPAGLRAPASGAGLLGLGLLGMLVAGVLLHRRVAGSVRAAASVLARRAPAARRAPGRRAQVLVAGTVAVAVASLGLPAVAQAADGASQTVFTTETFTGSGADSQFVLATTPSGANPACLTGAASGATDVTLPGCSTTPEASGSGALRLTGLVEQQEGAVTTTQSIPMSEGLDVQFTSYQYGGTGADGISFYLQAVDPLVASPPSPVALPGGSLGYSRSNSTATTKGDGLAYGYLGVGLDAYGNFLVKDYDGTGCTAAPGKTANAVTVRGSGNGQVGYCVLTKSSGFTGSLRGDTRAASAVPVEVVVNPSDQAVPSSSGSGLTTPPGSYTVAFTPVGGTRQVQTGALPSTLNGGIPAGTFPASWIDPESGYPYKFGYGWVGSTGGRTDVHEISNLTIRTLTGAVPTLTATDGGTATIADGYVRISPRVGTNGAAESHSVHVAVTFPVGTAPSAPTSGPWQCTLDGTVVECSLTPQDPVEPGTALPALDIPVARTETRPGTISYVVVSDDAAGTRGSIVLPKASSAVSGSETVVERGTYDVLRAELTPAGATGVVVFTDEASGDVVCMAIASAGKPTVCPVYFTERSAAHPVDVAYLGDADHDAATGEPVALRVVERDAPTVSAQPSTTAHSGWYGPGTTASLSADDGEDGSGVASIEYALGDGGWTTYTAPVALPDGTYDLRYRATDVDGNVSGADDLALRVDTTPPTVFGVVDSDRSLTVTGTDANLATVEYALGEGPWQTYSGPVDVGDDPVEVTYRATDEAGNVSTVGRQYVGVLVIDTAASLSGPSSVVVGSPVALVATVSPAAAQGSVEFFDGADSLGSAPLMGGRATVSVPAAVGSHAFSARFSGVGYYASAVSYPVATHVEKAAASVTAQVGSSSYGKPAVVTVGVTSLTKAATGTVTIHAGTFTRTATLTGGTAKVALPTTLAVGAHDVTVSYSGSAVARTAVASTTATVRKAPVSLTARLSKKKVTRSSKASTRVVVKVTVPGTSVRPTGPLTVKAKGTKTKKVSLTAVRKGKVTVRLKGFTHRGTVKVTVRYAGSTSVKAVAKKVSLRVR